MREETIILISGAGMLVAAIMQIILFFKLWKMTNNVQAIKDYLGCATSESDLMKEIYKHNPNIESLLFDAVYIEMNNAYKFANDSALPKIKEKYKMIYGRAGIDFPEILESINSCIDWNTKFKKIY